MAHRKPGVVAVFILLRWECLPEIDEVTDLGRVSCISLGFYHEYLVEVS